MINNNKEDYIKDYNGDFLNNLEYEGYKLLKEINSLKAEIEQLNLDHREDINKLNKRWCEATGYKDILDAKNTKKIEWIYKNKIQQLTDENNLLKNNIKIHNERGAGRKEMFKEGDKELIKMYRLQGHKIKDLAKMFDCSVGLIYKLINEE